MPTATSLSHRTRSPSRRTGLRPPVRRTGLVQRLLHLRLWQLRDVEASQRHGGGPHRQVRPLGQTRLHDDRPPGQILRTIKSPAARGAPSGRAARLRPPRRTASRAARPAQALPSGAARPQVGAERVAREAHRDVGVAFSSLLQLNVVVAAAVGLKRSDGRRQKPKDSQRSDHLQRRCIDDALGFFFARNVLVGGGRER